MTTAQSTAAIGWSFTPGSKSGTPGTTGGITNYAASTWTDSNTAGSGTATNWVGHAFQRPTLAASNASVTTTNAATVYIANSPLAGTNETLTNAYALWVDDGSVRFDGTVYNGAVQMPSIATQAEVNAATSTTTAITPNHNTLILGTAQATTSGTSFNFASIPAGTRRITVHFFGVSLSGTDDILVQLGDSGGIETGSYISTSAALAGAGTGVSSSTSGFIIRLAVSNAILSGIMTLELSTAASFLWVSSHAGKTSTTVTVCGGGEKALSAELTQLTITRSGTDTFDAGSVNVVYER